MQATGHTPEPVHQAAVGGTKQRRDRAGAAAGRTPVLPIAVVAPALLTAAVALPCERAEVAAPCAAAVVVVAAVVVAAVGRRSDIKLKYDITLLGYLDDGLGFYRFSYNGGNKAYVGVMAQDVQSVMPEAVVRGRDGYLRVDYEKLGLRFESYQQWIESGAQIPHSVPIGH